MSQRDQATRGQRPVRVLPADPVTPAAVPTAGSRPPRGARRRPVRGNGSTAGNGVAPAGAGVPRPQNRVAPPAPPQVHGYTSQPWARGRRVGFEEDEREMLRRTRLHAAHQRAGRAFIPAPDATGASLMAHVPLFDVPESWEDVAMPAGTAEDLPIGVDIPSAPRFGPRSRPGQHAPHAPREPEGPTSRNLRIPDHLQMAILNAPPGSSLRRHFAASRTTENLRRYIYEMLDTRFVTGELKLIHDLFSSPATERLIGKYNSHQQATSASREGHIFWQANHVELDQLDQLSGTFLNAVGPLPRRHTLPTPDTPTANIVRNCPCRPKTCPNSATNFDFQDPPRLGVPISGYTGCHAYAIRGVDLHYMTRNVRTWLITLFFIGESGVFHNELHWQRVRVNGRDMVLTRPLEGYEGRMKLAFDPKWLHPLGRSTVKVVDQNPEGDTEYELDRTVELINGDTDTKLVVMTIHTSRIISAPPPPPAIIVESEIPADTRAMAQVVFAPLTSVAGRVERDEAARQLATSLARRSGLTWLEAHRLGLKMTGSIQSQISETFLNHYHQEAMRRWILFKLEPFDFLKVVARQSAVFLFGIGCYVASNRLGAAFKADAANLIYSHPGFFDDAPYIRHPLMQLVGRNGFVP